MRSQTGIRHFWHQRVNQWLQKRIPPNHSHALDMRSVFILPTGFGWLYVVLCICLFILGTNYQNNLMLILCFILVALMLISLHASYWNFVRLTLKLSPIPSGYAGDNVSATLSLNAANKTKIAHGTLSISEYRESNIVQVDCDTTDKVQLSWQLGKRGRHQLPRLTLFSTFPFGLYRCWTHLDFDYSYLAYPAPEECRLQLHQQHQHNDDEGISLQTQPGTEDFAGLKAYVPGDSLNRVAWKQVAKQQQWVSKSFDTPVAVIGWLKLPVVDTEALESSLSKLAHQVNLCTQQQITFGLQLGNYAIEPSNGEQHRLACLRALALYPERPAN